MGKKITVIEATEKNEVIEEVNLRVCAYCRVSSMHEEQQNSFAAQVAHYTQYINQNPNWILIDIYADEGISGTNKERRSDFLRLINDCECGLIDLVITKSISRFARNTADCIEVVRKLKNLGIGVYFEKENINTLSGESELLLSILSSIAQEEMISLSQNIRWANQRRYSRGEFQVSPSKLTGYDVDPVTKGLVVNKEEAQLIKRIFKEYIGGKGAAKIARLLNEEGIPTITGKVWRGSSVRRMLKNEKYCGDVLMQKTITSNDITFKRKLNRGEQPQYYIKDNHEPIVSREEFELVQRLTEERGLAKGLTEDVKKKTSNRYVLSGKIVCGKCNMTYKRTTQNSGKMCARVAWFCSSAQDSIRRACSNGAIHDDTLQLISINVLKKLYENIDTLLVPFVEILREVNDISNDQDIIECDQQIRALLRQMSALTDLASKGSLTPVLYNRQMTEVGQKIKESKRKRENITRKHYANITILKDTEKIIDCLKSTEGNIDSLEKELVDNIFDKIIVKSRQQVVFRLLNGIELSERIGG